MYEKQTHLVAILGPKEAGKTEIFNVLAQKPFNEKRPVKLGSQITGIHQESTTVKLMDWGRNVPPEDIQLGKVSAVCLVADLNKENWQDEVNAYLTGTGINIPATTSIILLGNKIDLLTEEALRERGKVFAAYAKEKRMAYHLISAKNSTNIPTLTTYIFEHLPTEAFIAPPTKDQTLRRHSLSKVLRRAQTNSEYEDADGFLGDLIASDESSSEDNQEIRRVVTPNRPNRVGQQTAMPLSRDLRSAFEAASGDRTPGGTYTSLLPTPPANNDSYFAFTLRLIGMQLMLAALVSLIYLTMVAIGVLSPVMLLATVNQVVLTVGGLLGMNAPLATFSTLCATLGISTTFGAGALATGTSLMTMGIGYSLRRLGLRAPATEDSPAAPSASYFSFALRLVGMLLMAAALINIIYLLLIAAQVFSTVALTAGMNQLLVTVGGLLGMSAPVAAYAGACASAGLSTTTATSLLSATGSALFGGIGYGMFRAGRPAAAPDNSTENRQGLAA